MGGLPVKMEAQVNMLHFFAQLQKKIELDLKTNTTQNHQKIKLYGNLTTKDLKIPHSSRQVVGGEAEMGRKAQDEVQSGEVAELVVPHSLVEDKNQEGYLGGQGSQPQARTPEKELNKMEITNLSDADFKSLAVRLLYSSIF